MTDIEGGYSIQIPEISRSDSTRLYLCECFRFLLTPSGICTVRSVEYLGGKPRYTRPDQPCGLEPQSSAVELRDYLLNFRQEILDEISVDDNADTVAVFADKQLF